MPNELPDKVKKNLLDLQYNKYLQYYNTAIIVLFTYVIGVVIAFVTKQIDYTNPNQLVLVGVISIAVIIVIVLLMLKFRGHLANILTEIKKLKL